MVGFGSEQGISFFETTGIVNYFEDFKKAKTPLRAKRCRFRMDIKKCPGRVWEATFTHTKQRYDPGKTKTQILIFARN